MNKKVDLIEVNAMSKKVATAKEAVVSDLNTVSACIDQLSSMESFQGETANSAKEYFSYGHQTIIASFQHLFINIHENLKNHIDTFQTNVDKSESTRIFSHYLEDLEQNIDENFTSLEEVSNNVNRTLIEVSDLIPMSNPDFNHVRYAHSEIHKIIENLRMNLDTFSKQVKNEGIEEMLNQLSNLMKELQTYKGQDRFDNLNKRTIAILQEILFEDKSPFSTLFIKMANGENLNSNERDMLYNLLQNIYLDNDMKDEIENIAAIINEEDIDKLKDRLNAQVVMTKGTLEDEMAKVMAYLYIGNLRPSETNVDRESRAKLEAYFMLLKNYSTAMSRWDEAIAKVEELNYEKDPNDLSGHYFGSRLRMGPYREVDRKNMTLEEYRDYALRDNGLDGDPVKFFNNSEVTYYTKANAHSTYSHLENKKLLKEQANSTYKFIGAKILDKVIGTAADLSKTSIIVGTFGTLVEHDIEQGELEDKITIGKAQEVAGMLKMEFVISESATVSLGQRPKLAVQLHPTEKSFEVLDRWEEEHKKDPNLPYPKEQIEALDWEGINEFLIEYDTKIPDDIADYITDG